MSEVGKTCSNCEYEHEDIEGTHCRHCIHNAIENFKEKGTSKTTKKEIINKAIDDFAADLKLYVFLEDAVLFDKVTIYKFINKIAEEMKGEPKTWNASNSKSYAKE